MLIFGPKQPVNDIDVFLEPLMQDMKKLWEEGVEMMDASLKKKFTLKAIIFVTITDYPGLFSLSGQIKGKTNCVVCINGTYYTYLKESNKIVYTRHRQFLVKKHRYQKDTMIKYFDNQPEPQLNEPEWASYGEKVFRMVKDMDQVEFGKNKKEIEAGTTRKRKRDKEEPSVVSVPFKKKSIFFRYLSYWKTLDTPPCHRLHAPGEECL
jgi:hypothetical protein